MTTPTLTELRRILGQALLAAPLLVACRSTPKQEPRGGATPDAVVANVVVPDAAPPKKLVCAHDPPDITGCGGAEVRLTEPASACDLPARGSNLTKAQCDDYCADFDTRDCHVYEDRDGKPGVFCNAANPCLGRPPSTGAAAGGLTDGVAGFLAAARRLEAQSVDAFVELEADLARWGAPAALLAACRRAAADEARHAAAMAALLEARGGATDAVPAPAARGFASLFALALHNEREGAVGETWGALVARHQAEHARDADVRAAMAAIADEEAEHAALSFQIAAWARSVLSPEEARALDDARRDALARLRATGGARPSADAADALGWPGEAASAAMIDVLGEALA